jgi:hypothetical protein
MATDSPKPMSPTAAVLRHLEWLEFALVAARDEELRRQGRLDRATDKNRDKRTVRLAEVTAEVLELAALVKGIKDLQTGAAAPARKPRATKRASGTIRRAGVAAASTAAPKAGPVAKTRPAAKAHPASKTPKSPAPKKRAASGSKPASTRARRPRAAAKPSAAGASATETTAPTGPTV